MNSTPSTGFAAPPGANIRKTCVPHTSTGAESQVRCSIHSIICSNGRRSFFDDDKRLKDDELRVTATVYGMGIPFHSAPASTKTQPPNSKLVSPKQVSALEFAIYNQGQSPNHITYQFDNQLLLLPALWRDLPRDACIAFNVLGSTGNQLYGTTLRLFDLNGLLRTGLQKLFLYPDKEADARPGVVGPSSTGDTPGVAPSLLARREFYSGGREHLAFTNQSNSKFNEGYGPEHEQVDPKWKACLIIDKLTRSQAALKNPNVKKKMVTSKSTTAGQLSGQHVTSVPWLDALTMQRCTEVLRSNSSSKAEQQQDGDFDDQTFPLIENQQLYYPRHPLESSTGYFASPEEMLAHSSFLIIELPNIPVPVVHEEAYYPHTLHGASGSITAYELSIYYKRLETQKKKR